MASPVRIISLNAGKKLGDDDSQAAFLDFLGRRHSAWQIAFIAEADGRLNSNPGNELFGGVCPYKRFWPGPGSYAFLVLYRPRFSSAIGRLEARGRCLLLSIRLSDSIDSVITPALIRPSEDLASSDRGKQAFNLLFMHGSHTDLRGCLADACQLLKKAVRGTPTFFLGDLNVDQMPRDRSDPFKLHTNRDLHHLDRRRDLDNMCRLHKFRLLPVAEILGSQAVRTMLSADPTLLPAFQ